MRRNKITRNANAQPFTYRTHITTHNSAASPQPKRRRSRRGARLIPLLIAGIGLAIVAIGSMHGTAHHNQNTDTSVRTVTAGKSVAVVGGSPCAGNSLTSLVLVRISQRRLWACESNLQLYASSVVTGMAMYPADITPIGTYHIYDKETDQDLKGCDSTGCWNDHVNYWMPWLSNQYGTYGFHDATWRPESAFGNISPNSANASHGCVELPLATAQWLYNWVQVGTTVQIEN